MAIDSRAAFHVHNNTTGRFDLNLDLARFPQFSSYLTRLTTFSAWPCSMPQSPEDLAESGFVYLGVGDHVQCFFCGGGLKNWDADNLPVEEHVRWFGERCQFIIELAGPKIVEKIRTADSNSIRREAFISYGNESPTTMKAGESYFAEDQCIVPKGKTDNVGSKEDTFALEKKLMEENDLLRMEISCKVCWNSDAEVVFLPCNHLVTCVDCAVSVQGCPMCRSVVDGFLKTRHST